MQDKEWFQFVFKACKNILTNNTEDYKVFCEEFSLNLDGCISIKELKSFNKFAAILLHEFPTVFKECFVLVQCKTLGVEELKIRLSGISYKKVEKQLYLKSISFRPIVFMLYFPNEYSVLFNKRDLNDANTLTDNLVIIENVVIHKLLSENFTSSTTSKTLDFIHDDIGNNFSYGELLDYIDRCYDFYKQLFISPGEFYLLFCSFGYAINDIGNRAFEKYNLSRDGNGIWKDAISDYLKQEVQLKDVLISQLVKALF